MSDPQTATFSFTKLVVDDLEKMSAFYRRVYDLKQIARYQGHIGSEAIDEIMLGHGESVSPGSLVLLKYVDRPAARTGELILGFTTNDLARLLEKLQAAGGRIHAGIKELPELRLKVAFATDPEGHLAELVQMQA